MFKAGWKTLVPAGVLAGLALSVALESPLVAQEKAAPKKITIGLVAKSIVAIRNHPHFPNIRAG